MRRYAILGALLTLSGFYASAGWAQDAKAIYGQRCASCHGASGQGDGPAGKVLKVKPPVFATALPSKSDADIAKTIKEGIVAGQPTHPKSGALNDEQIRSLVEYVKQLK